MKILFAVSLLAIVAAAAMAFMTRSKFLEARNEKDSINKSILDTQASVERVNGETTKTWADWFSTMKDAKDMDTARKQLERDTAAEEDMISELTKQIEAIFKERDDMNAKIKEIIGRDGTPEEVIAKVNELKGIVEGLEKDLDAAKKEMEIANKAANVADAESARRKAIQNARETSITLTGRSSTILEVNHDFAFVRIGIGRRDGLTSDAKLLVKRGSTLIANLKIVILDNNQTIADIEMKTVRPGTVVMPGDLVVVETSVQ
jgi:chromosome segregation ATPase